jgi:hypothetical protein
MLHLSDGSSVCDEIARVCGACSLCPNWEKRNVSIFANDQTTIATAIRKLEKIVELFVSVSLLC